MIANCKRCDRLFQKTIRDICPSCIREQQELVGVIRNHLKKHPYATVPEVAQATQIDVEDIVDLIEQNALNLVDFPNFTLTCERCERVTQDGRFCNSCKEEMAVELANMTKVVRSAKNDFKSLTKGYFSK